MPLPYCFVGNENRIINLALVVSIYKDRQGKIEGYSCQDVAGGYTFFPDPLGEKLYRMAIRLGAGSMVFPLDE